MSRFAHKLCPVCRAPFGESDDIVVCPECGTPHHRACYLKKGSCGVEEYHKDGFVWEGRLPNEQPAPEINSIPSMPEASGNTNPDPHHAEYPQGTPRVEPQLDMEEFAEQMLESRDNPSDERGEDGVSMHELVSYAGQNFHFISAFSLFRLREMSASPWRNISLNFCMAVLQPIYQFYRRIDGLGILLTLWAFASIVPAIMLEMGFGAGNTAVTNTLAAVQVLLNLLSFAITVGLLLYGDFIYYKTAVRRIKKIRAAYDDGKAEGYFEKLEENGRPSILRMIVAVLSIMVIIAAVSMFAHNGMLFTVNDK